ncbi:MAG: FHA domain-containing protein [Gemmatimonadaceae bacterium]
MIVLVLVPLLVTIVAALVFGVYLPRRRRYAMRHGPIPLAVAGRRENAILPPRPVRVTPERAAAVAERETTQPTPSAPAMPVEARAQQDEAIEERGRVLRLQVAGDRPHFVRDGRADDQRDERTAVTLRLERPHDGTLQFLPGRLEILEGRDAGKEIRFVQTPGPDGSTITFGRSEGAYYRHVQLHEPTVSRLHAKLVLDGRTWSLVNLSETNPVVVNGLPVAGEGSSVVLREGDRIELGEVLFRFRAK